MDFTIPQQELAHIPVGAATRIVLPGMESVQTLEGKVSAAEPNADPTTRAVKLRASVNSHRKAQLGAGMFVNVSVVLPEQVKVVWFGPRRSPGASFRRLGLRGERPARTSKAIRRAGATVKPAVRPASNSSAWGRPAATSSPSWTASRPGKRSSRRGRSSCATAPRSWSTTRSSCRRPRPAAGEPLYRGFHRHLRPAGPCFRSWST